MLITDAQIHIWGPDTPERPWPRDGIQPQRPEPLGAPEVVAEMDRAGVARAVLVPPSWEGYRNDLALSAVAAYPGRFAVMGRIDVTQPGSVDLSTWRDQPGMLGIRVNFSLPQLRALLPDGSVEWLFSAAERFGIPLMVLARGQADALVGVARRHPELRLIVDHLNLPGSIQETEIGPEIDKVLPLSRLPNVAVKVSCLPSLVRESYPFPSLHPHIRRVIDAFGPERCMWGSDLSRLSCPYVDWVRIAEALAFLSEPDKELLMGGSLANWLDWR